jgi:hypothetical protein
VPKGYLIPSPLINGKTFRELAPNAQRVLVQAVWCSPMRRSEGLSSYRIPYVMADLGMRQAEAEDATDAIQSAGFVQWDPDHDAILDLYAVKFNPLRNGRDMKTGEIRQDKRMKTALRHIEEFVESPLLARLLEVADEYSPDLATEMRLRFPNLDNRVSSLAHFQRRG